MTFVSRYRDRDFTETVTDRGKLKLYPCNLPASVTLMRNDWSLSTKYAIAGMVGATTFTINGTVIDHFVRLYQHLISM
jgi:hypothetical protein